MDKKCNLLAEYLIRQVHAYFPDGYDIKEPIFRNIEKAICRTEQCIGSIITWRGKGFDYLVSGQYATFLYYLSNTTWRDSGDANTAVRIFLLNKALNGIDLFYEIEMPRYFAIAHTVGMVFSKAEYGDYCAFHQGCTVGRNGMQYPRLGNGVVMFPGSMIIGNCLVRDNTVIAPGVKLIDTETPGDCYVFSGKNGQPIFKKLTRYYADEYFARLLSSEYIHSRSKKV